MAGIFESIRSEFASRNTQHLKDAGLWNKEDANPDEVAAAIQSVSQSYAQRGAGSGSAWHDTFNHMSSAYDRSLMEQWTGHVGELRDDTMKTNAINDATTQFLAHNQLQSVDDIAKGMSTYIDKTHANLTMSQSEANEVLVQGALNAHDFALAHGQPDVANNIAAAFDKIPTHTDASGNVQYLSKTALGAKALEQMHNKEWQNSARAHEEYSQKRLEDRDAVMTRLLQWKDVNKDKKPSEVSSLPQTLIDAADFAGIDSQKFEEDFRNSRLISKDAVSREDAQTALDLVESMRTDARNVTTETGLDQLEQSAHEYDNDPLFKGAQQRAHLNSFYDELAEQRKAYNETGKLTNPAYRTADVTVRRMAQTASAIATEHLAKYEGNPADLNNILSKHKVELRADDSIQGGSRIAFSDLDSQMQSDFRNQAEAMRGDRPWVKVPQAEFDRRVLPRHLSRVEKKPRPNATPKSPSNSSRNLTR